MKKSGFFNSAQSTTDRQYQALDFALPLGALAGGKAGVLMGIGGSFKPKWKSGGSFTLGSGFAFCGEMPGWWYFSDEEITITLDSANPASTPCFALSTVQGQTRTNLLAIKMDGETDRKVDLVVLSGDLVGGAYEAPVIDNSDGYDTYYVPIAKVITDETQILDVTDIRVSTSGQMCLSIPEDTLGDPLVRPGYCGIQRVRDEDTDDDLIADVFKGEWYEDYLGIGISDGKMLITQGLCNIEDETEFPDGLEWPVTYYVQDDGKISTSPTKKIAGYSLSESLLLVNLQGPFGQNDVYEEDMINFNVMPGTTGKVRFKIKLPENALGVLLKYKTSQWVEGDDIETGIEIADLDTDDGYNGNNNWYECEILGADDNVLTDGTLIYVKAFPYTSSHNETIGSNEKQVTVGVLRHEWTADNIEGASNDSAGTKDLMLSSIGTESGHVGDTFVGSAGYATIPNDLTISGNTLTFLLWHTGTNTGLFGHSSIQHVYGRIESNYMKLGARNYSGVFFETSYLINPGQYYSVAVTTSGNDIELYLDGELQTSVTVDSSLSRIISYIGRANYGITSNYFIDMNCKMDQIRFFQGKLSESDIQNLHNGGIGC